MGSITCYDIISVLVDKKEEIYEEPIIESLPINFLDYSYIVFEDLLKLIPTDKKVSDIINFLEKTSINKNINKKKLITLLKGNVINNDVLLLLSGFFEINIWIYYKINKTIKVFYLDTYLNIDKKNIVFVNDKDGYKRADIELYNSDDKDFSEFINKYINIPIGLKENKKKIIGKDMFNPLYINSDNCIQEYAKIIEKYSNLKHKFFKLI